MGVRDLRTHEQRIADFINTYGEIGKAVLAAFNKIDCLGLSPGKMTPEDEYLRYAERFVRRFLAAPKNRRGTANIALILFQCFHPKQFLGIGEVRRFNKGRNLVLAHLSIGDAPDITRDNVVALARDIFERV